MNEPFPAAEVADRPSREKIKVRTCLRCATTFESSWSGERICPHCKRSHAWRSGEALRHRPSVGR